MLNYNITDRKILTLLYLFSTNKMQRNFKVITHHQHSCTKTTLVRTVDKNMFLILHHPIFVVFIGIPCDWIIFAAFLHF